jgi:thiamine monophosphate synthase
VWALGGLAPEHAAAVRASGASGMAVLSGILPRDDVEARVGAYLANWAEVGG